MGICASTSSSCQDKEEEPCKTNSSGAESIDTNENISPTKACDFEFLRRGGKIEEEILHLISDRMVLSGSTKVASLCTVRGTKGVNQDSMIVWENFCSREDTVFCGVFDGHGPFGHKVSKKVRDSIPLKLCSIWKAKMGDYAGPYRDRSLLESLNRDEYLALNSKNDELEYESLHGSDQSNNLPHMYFWLRKALLVVFKLVDKELKQKMKSESYDSGSTAVILIKQGYDLVIGNVGDSRAVLGTRDRHNSFVAMQLTEDLKPNLPREAARIRQCRGRVFAAPDDPGVTRIWLPDSDSPGLAMARAFGDFCLKDFGLISVPDMSYYRVTQRDEFIILASDGVWDVLSNQEAVNIVASVPNHATAARAVVDRAVREWKIKYPSSRSDDCVAVVLFVHPSLSNQVERSAFAPTYYRNGPLHHSTEDEECWTALEGVARLNSVLSLPRYNPGQNNPTSWR